MGLGKKILHPLHVKKFATILVGVVTELTETYLFKHNKVFFPFFSEVLRSFFFPFFTECVSDRFIQALTD